MRKQELVHLHGVLVEVTQTLVEEGAVSAEIWSEYETLGITPNSIHAQKSDHEEAVRLLATRLGAAVEQPKADGAPVLVG
jgi:hypothetical protein